MSINSSSVQVQSRIASATTPLSWGHVKRRKKEKKFVLVGSPSADQEITDRVHTPVAAYWRLSGLYRPAWKPREKQTLTNSSPLWITQSHQYNTQALPFRCHLEAWSQSTCAVTIVERDVLPSVLLQSGSCALCSLLVFLPPLGCMQTEI